MNKVWKQETKHGHTSYIVLNKLPSIVLSETQATLEIFTLMLVGHFSTNIEPTGAPSTKEFPGRQFSDSVAGIIASFMNQFKQW